MSETIWKDNSTIIEEYEDFTCKVCNEDLTLGELPFNIKLRNIKCPICDTEYHIQAITKYHIIRI